MFPNVHSLSLPTLQRLVMVVVMRRGPGQKLCGGDDSKDNNENYNQPSGEENEEKTRRPDLLFGKMVNQLLGTPSKTT